MSDEEPKSLEEMLMMMQQRNNLSLPDLLEYAAMLLEEIYSLQEFLENQGHTADDYREWQDQKLRRILN